jgi:hypothetical protein
MATIAERLRRAGNLGNRAVFNAIKAEVLAAVDEGHTYAKIWKMLKNEGVIRCSYSQFCRYLNDARKPQGFTPVGRVSSVQPQGSRELPRKEAPPPVAEPQDSTSIASFKREQLKREDLI